LSNARNSAGQSVGRAVEAVVGSKVVVLVRETGLLAESESGVKTVSLDAAATLSGDSVTG